MSANLAIDTNVLLLADKSAACLQILNLVMREPNEYCLYLDRERKIDREYQAYADNASCEDSEAAIAMFVEWLNERESAGRNRLQSKINGKHIFPEECRSSAEAALIGISCGQSNFYLITSDDQHIDDEPIKRCYRDSQFGNSLRQILKQAGNPINMLPAQQHDLLRELTQLNIQTYDQLHSFLQRHRIDPSSAERTSVELKCPQNELTEGMIDAVMKAICGMLNSLEGNGYIFIGVQDGDQNTLCIKGIPLSYDSKSRGSWDELKRIVTDRWHLFTPKIPDRIDFEIVIDSDNPNRGVMLLRIRPDKLDRGYAYKNQKYIRIGERSEKVN